MKRLIQRVPRIFLVLIALAIFGLVRAPFEKRLRTELVESHMLIPPPAQSAMQNMGQSVLMGTLGGLRSLVATYLVLDAYGHFSDKEWDELYNNFSIVTNLEPREESHWVALIWHMGINATANMELDRSLPEFERKRRFNDYALLAVDVAEKGLEHLPDSVGIRLQLAEVYKEKLKDNEAVSRVYGETMDLPGAPGYTRRFHGYFMAKIPGKEQKSYDYLMSLYRMGDRHKLPTLIVEIKRLEKFLGIPASERITDENPLDKRRPKKPDSNALPGGIVIP